MYNWEPTLPIDIKYNMANIEVNESKHTFNKETFDAVLTTAISMTGKIHQTAGENIYSEQKKQRCEYNWRHQVPNKIDVGQKVLLQN